MHINNIILIDDDNMNNIINTLLIQEYYPNIAFQVFTNPEDGLAYTLSIINDTDKKSALLLDIRMPELTGWELLDKLAQYSTQIKTNFRIYILSSSINPKDVARASQNGLVSGFFEKPLTSLNFKALYDEEM